MGKINKKKFKPNRGGREKKMKKAFSGLVVLGLLGFLSWNIVQNWHTTTSIEWNLLSINGLLLFLFLFLVYVVNIFSWHMVTRALGANVSFKGNVRIWMLSNLSRLLPGGIWQYPSRIYLLSKEKISKTLGATAVIAEALFTLSVGAAVVFASLAFWQLPEKFVTYGKALWTLLFVPLLLIILLTNQKVINRAVALIAKVKGKREAVLRDIRIPPVWLPVLITAFLARFLVIGSALFFLTRLVLPLDLSLLPIFIGVFSLSWLLGYITLLAPAGLGVTEVSLTALLSLYIPFSIAAVLAIAFRVALVGTEIIFLLVAFLFIKERQAVSSRS